MKRLFQRLFPRGVAILLCLSLACPALAAESPLTPEAARAILREQGIYQGDGSGNLMLDKGLTRAELAAILTRIHGEGTVDPNLAAGVPICQGAFSPWLHNRIRSGEPSPLPIRESHRKVALPFAMPWHSKKCHVSSLTARQI